MSSVPSISDFPPTLVGQPGVTSGARQRGRPRDETLRSRCLDAAIDVYASLGWSGFNFESVAQEASVGRPALYRRWTDRGALLIDAMLHASPTIEDVDLGSLSDELARVLADYVAVLQGNRGRAGQRLYLDGQVIPDVLAAVHASLMGQRYEVVSNAIERASSRAGSRPLVSVRLAFSLLLGPALLWNVAEQGPSTLDVAVVVASVASVLGLPTEDATANHAQSRSELPEKRESNRDEG